MIRTPYIEYYRNPLDNLPCMSNCPSSVTLFHFPSQMN